MKANIGKIGIVYTIFVLIAVIVVVKIIKIQYITPPKSTEYTKKTIREDVTEGTRGSILASDGRYLAFSTPQYIIAMDCTVVPDSIFNADVEGLARALSEGYSERSTQEYVKLLKAQKNKNSGNKYLRLLKQSVSYEEMQNICSFPILNRGRARGGVILEKVDHREYPYGRLAYRTLGYLRNNQDKPKIGIEGSRDTILRGKSGLRPMRLIEHNQWIRDVEKDEIPPQDGMDIQITIDIDIQDIAEKALLKKISDEEDLTAGAAIVMDVKSGEIKAMVNMEKRNGKFDETYNYAIGRLGEPGSVFKLATLVTVLEDKKATLETEMPAIVNWNYAGRVFTDNYLRNYKEINVKKGLEISSNNVFRMLAALNYNKNPQSFVDKLNNDRKISYNYNFDIEGLGKASILGPKERKERGMYWSDSDLPQIGMGYALELTPLHIISFYNAIANDGIMVKPHLIRNYQKHGVVKKEFPTEEISRVCSKETASKAKEALRGVVTGDNGTARVAFKGCKVDVAGKTGTARMVIPGSSSYMDASGRKMHQGSFVGFFPYENPKYSVIVVVYSRLATKNFYGGTWGGPVAREIVDKIYAASPDWNEAEVAGNKMPEQKPYPVEAENDTTEGVPSVIGMGLRDALYLLESQGYRTVFTGEGKVVGEDPDAGTLIDQKEAIKLILRNNHVTEKDTIGN